MESECNKLFVGGITQSTNAANLREYFSKYGEVKNAQIMRNRLTGVSRGFAFVSFTDQSSMESALQNDEHQILGRRVAVNIPRPIEKKPMGEVSSDDINQSSPLRVNKIFVGGLPPNLMKEEFDRYFETFGRIIDSVIMCNKQNNTPRGFGFVTYDSDESVQKVIINRFHQLSNKWVDVKRAIPRGEARTKFYGHDSYQCFFGYGPSSGPYLSYPLPSPITCGYYIYDAYANKMGAPNMQYHGQPFWVNDPNFALYPSYYYNMPLGQLGNSYVDPTYMDYRVNENGRGRADGPSGSFIAVYDNDIAESVTIKEVEVVENGVCEKPNDEISQVIIHADGVSSCGSPKVVENEVSETPKEERSDLIAHANGVTEATSNCSSCETLGLLEDGVSGTLKDQVQIANMKASSSELYRVGSGNGSTYFGR